MKCILAAIFAVFVALGITDYRKHVIPNYYLVALIIFAATYKYLTYGVEELIVSVVCMLMVFAACTMAGFIYMNINNEDIAGGGDYKLLAVIGFIIGIKGLLFCLICEMIFEIAYRYILFPERKHMALPLGASLGFFSIVILIIMEVF